MQESLRALVRHRAGNRCEYCRIHQDYDRFFRFQIDHIIALQHGGLTHPENLCLTCFRCNAHKGPNIAGVDPQSGEVVRLFHPRRDDWIEHFEWAGARLVGRTAIGRTTVIVLAINHPDHVTLRATLRTEGAFPAE